LKNVILVFVILYIRMYGKFRENQKKL